MKRYFSRLFFCHRSLQAALRNTLKKCSHLSRHETLFLSDFDNVVFPIFPLLVFAALCAIHFSSRVHMNGFFLDFIICVIGALRAVPLLLQLVFLGCAPAIAPYPFLTYSLTLPESSGVWCVHPYLDAYSVMQSRSGVWAQTNFLPKGLKFSNSWNSAPYIVLKHHFFNVYYYSFDCANISINHGAACIFSIALKVINGCNVIIHLYVTYGFIKNPLVILKPFFDSFLWISWFFSVIF